MMKVLLLAVLCIAYFACSGVSAQGVPCSTQINNSNGICATANLTHCPSAFPGNSFCWDPASTTLTPFAVDSNGTTKATEFVKDVAFKDTAECSAVVAALGCAAAFEDVPLCYSNSNNTYAGVCYEDCVKAITNCAKVTLVGEGAAFFYCKAGNGIAASSNLNCYHINVPNSATGIAASMAITAIVLVASFVFML